MNNFNCCSRNCKSTLFKVHSLMDIKTFIFLDTETTGLPAFENNRTKITELCMVAVEASHIRLGVFPRVQNKLSLCFNPWKFISSESEKMTGLSNTILERQLKFSTDTVNTINSFLNHNQKPLCFVAHNGNNFDYPILHREIEKTGAPLMEDIFCIDSLYTFRQLHFEELRGGAIKSSMTEMASSCLSIAVETDDEVKSTGGVLNQKIVDIQKRNETTPKKQLIEVFPSIPNPPKKVKAEYSRKHLNFDISFKLSDVYTRLTKRSPIVEHQAESDVMMLIMCAVTLGDKFVNWANANTKKFCDIPAMVPGKKIGT